jgi:hypothetical protein
MPPMDTSGHFVSNHDHVKNQLPSVQISRHTLMAEYPGSENLDHRIRGSMFPEDK